MRGWNVRTAGRGRGALAVTAAATLAAATALVTFNPPTAGAAAGPGGVLAWGAGTNGRLGDGKTTDRHSAVTVTLPGGRQAVDVATGDAHSLAVASDGTLWAWGANASGQLGDGSTTSHSSPVAVTLPGGRLAAQVSAGNATSYAVATDGSLWSWGVGSSGELGSGSTSNRTSPGRVTIPGSRQVLMVSGGGQHAAAVATDETVWGWGLNSYGEVGDASTSTRTSPVAVTVPGGRAVYEVAAGAYFTLAVALDGTLWSWGDNSSGQLGDGTTTRHTSPSAVGSLPGAGTPVHVSAGAAHSLAVTSNGGLFAWGIGTYGRLGDGTTTQHKSPVAIALPGARTVVSAGAGSTHSVALASDGTVWAWGRNAEGEVGDTTSTTQLSPVRVDAAGGTPLTGIEAIATDTNHTLAIGRSNVQVTPDPASLGTVTVGLAGTATVTVTDTGVLPIVITGWAVTGADASSFGTNTDTSTCLTTLTAGATCTITVTFTPTTPGTKTATLTIDDNATGAPHHVTLTGTASEPPPTGPLVVLPADAALTPLLSELAGNAPDALALATLGSTDGTFTVPSCPSAPLPADDGAFADLLAGAPYGAIDGSTAPALPARCRPAAMTTFGAA